MYENTANVLIWVAFILNLRKPNYIIWHTREGFDWKLELIELLNRERTTISGWGFSNMKCLFGLSEVRVQKISKNFYSFMKNAIGPISLSRDQIHGLTGPTTLTIVHMGGDGHTKTPRISRDTRKLGPLEGGGSGVQDGEHMHICGWFMSMYGKITTIL